MPRKLRNLVVDRVDLVDRGANFDPESGEGSFILLAKRQPEDEVAKRAAIVKKANRDYARGYRSPDGDLYAAEMYEDEDYGPSYRRALEKVSKDADPAAQLDTLCKAFAEEYLPESDDKFNEGPPWTPEKRLAEATEIILRSPRGRALYAEIRAVKRERRPRSLTFAERLGRTHEPDDMDAAVTAGACIAERERMTPTIEEQNETDALLAMKRTTGRWH